MHLVSRLRRIMAHTTIHSLTHTNHHTIKFRNTKPGHPVIDNKITRQRGLYTG